jgi:DNA-binding CsgD family transcriptional regulator
MASSPDNFTDEGSERRRPLGVAALLLGVALVSGLDLLGDLREGAGWGHLAVEGVLGGLSVGGLVHLARRWWVSRREARALETQAQALEAQAKRLGDRAERLSEAVEQKTQESHAQRRELEALGQDLAASRREAARWRQEHGALVRGLGAAVDRQFEDWGLTVAEKEVAGLLIKGLSLKELAELRGVSEATARQQARSIYKKANLGGRHELAAFFLEDLLGPPSVARVAEAQRLNMESDA